MKTYLPAITILCQERQKAMSKKTIHVATVLEEINRRLKLNTITQEEKQGLCSFVEFVLMQTDNYNGFNNNYWLSIGSRRWIDSPYASGIVDEKNPCNINDMSNNEVWKEKEKYIIGPEGAKNKDNPTFLSALEGEWSRTYFSN